MSGQGLISASFEEGRVSWMKERKRVFQAEKRLGEAMESNKIGCTLKETTGIW